MKVGDKIKKVYPFQHYETFSFDGELDNFGWGMGCRKVQEGCSQYSDGELFFVADGEGFIDIEILAIVDMPRKIKQRVLYKFDQILPDGVIKKSSKVYTVSIDVFTRLITGWAYFHEYTVEDE